MNYAKQIVSLTAKIFVPFLVPVIAGEPSNTTLYTYTYHVAVQAPRQFVGNIFIPECHASEFIKKK